MLPPSEENHDINSINMELALSFCCFQTSSGLWRCVVLW